MPAIYLYQKPIVAPSVEEPKDRLAEVGASRPIVVTPEMDKEERRLRNRIFKTGKKRK